MSACPALLTYNSGVFLLGQALIQVMNLAKTFGQRSLF